MQPTADSTRKPHRGTSRCLVIAIDVGTTFSGVSYAILEPGEVPKIHGVTRFPGQEHVAGNSKIPSIMYYDKSGTMKVAGAEAESASIVSRAEDGGWIKAELFKLRLRPKSMKLDMNGMRLSPLPRNKSATRIYGDFLSYLFHCTRDFIKDTHANGEALWNAVEHDIQFVLSHPNGWEGAQQMRIRKSAIYGGLIPNTNEGKARIRFVTEGEASLHACVLNGLAADVLSNPSNPGFIVVDAGGGTLDISSYAIRGTSPLTIEEIAPPDCIFAGSVFVSHRAREFLTEKLKNSKYGSADSVDHITKKFDETTKRLFRDRQEPQFIVFGSPFDKDLSLGIRSGQLKLTGDEVAKLFEPSVEAAVVSIKAQIDASAGLVKSVWLVGGFAASPYLFKQLQERLAPLNVTVSRPDSQTSKAVADGAIGFYCDHHVSARMSKYLYGVEYLREYDSKDSDHVARKGKLCELPSGPKLLPDAFDCILARSVKVKESTVFTRKYCTELTSLSTLSYFEVDIWCYKGGDTIPKWILRQGEHFSTLCVVRADLSPLTGSAQPKQGKNGKTYWTIIFSVEIQFGLTEFKARIKWVENGETKYGPATIVYNESGHYSEDEDPDSDPEEVFPLSGQLTGHAPRSSRDLPVPTSGHVSPNTFKAVPASVPAHSEFSVSAPTISPKIERTVSKTEPASPHPLPKASAYESSRQEEKEREKGKAKELAGTLAADKKTKTDPPLPPSSSKPADKEEVKQDDAKDKGKKKEAAATDKKGKKGAKREDDTPKVAVAPDAAWDSSKNPVIPKETAAEPPTFSTTIEETPVDTAKEKEKTKSQKKNAKKNAIPKSVGFYFPEEEDPVQDPPKISPTNTKSPLADNIPSHSTKHAEPHIGEYHIDATQETGRKNDHKNESPLAPIGTMHDTKSNFGLNDFDWESKNDDYLYNKDNYGSTGDHQAGNSFESSWDNGGVSAVPTYMQHNTEDFDNIDIDPTLEDKQIHSWEDQYDQPDHLSSPYHVDLRTEHSTTADFTQPQPQSSQPSGPLNLDNTLDFGQGSSNIFDEFSAGNFLSETTAPQEDKFSKPSSTFKKSRGKRNEKNTSSLDEESQNPSSTFKPSWDTGNLSSLDEKAQKPTSTFGTSSWGGTGNDFKFSTSSVLDSTLPLSSSKLPEPPHGTPLKSQPSPKAEIDQHLALAGNDHSEEPQSLSTAAVEVEAPTEAPADAADDLAALIDGIGGSDNEQPEQATSGGKTTQQGKKANKQANKKKGGGKKR